MKRERVPVGGFPIRVDRFVVVAARADDDCIAAPDDVPPDAPAGIDHSVLLALDVSGDAALAIESAALEKVRGDARFPQVVGDGVDSVCGPWLAITAPRGSTLSEVAASFGVGDALASLRAALSMCESLEGCGLSWTPRTDDLRWTDTGLALARLRGAHRLAAGERLDAQRAIEALGGGLVPYPAVRGSPRLVRLLAPPPPLAIDRVRTVEELQRELDEIDVTLQLPECDARNVSALGDRGLRRDHDEDAFALAAGETHGEPWTVMVVCDGVSSSSHAEQASTLAARTTRDALAHFARGGDIVHEDCALAVAEAIRAAHLIICVGTLQQREGDLPGTTLVAAVVYRGRVSVGWVGDSRAYWVSKHEAVLLTRDHSWVNETVARGEMTEAEALASPLAHALTRCLGPLEVSGKLEQIVPSIVTRTLDGPGHLVLCTDGLWNYFPTAEGVAKLMHAADPKSSPAALARLLVNHALARGGHDNVTVAVYEHE